MTFAISVVSNIPRITQSGTDSALAGIDTMITSVAAVAVLTPYAVGDVRKPPATNGMWYRCTTLGTAAAVAPLYNPVSGTTTTDGTAVFTAFLAPFSFPNGSLRTYIFPEVDFEITGTLTIANPQWQTYTCRRLHTSSTCTYTSGSFMADGVTPKFHGVHFTTAMKGANDFQEVSDWNGVWSIRGGMYQIAASIKPAGTSLQTFHSVTVVSSADWSRSIRWRAYNTQTRYLNGCSFYNAAFDAFAVPITLNAKGYASEYVSEYVGSSAGGTDSKMEVYSLSNQDGQFDFDNYGAGWVELYNCAKGAAIEMRNLSSAANHCVPLFQNINFVVTNLQGVAQDNVSYTTTDAPTNSPTITITTASSLKTWDFRNPITLTGTTAGGGLASSVPCLKVWHGATNIQNLRYPASTATYRFCGYYVMQQDVTVVLGSDTVITKGVAMQAATNLSLTPGQAAALTGIALAPSGATGGVATITVARTLSELWQFFRSWKPTNMSSDDSWSFNGTTLNVGAWTIVGAENLSVGTLVTSSATANGALSNLSITGAVTQATPTNLTNVTVVGNLSYNTAATVSITYSSVSASLVKNDGVGIVTITPSGTGVIGNYSDPEINYLDSSLTIINATSAVVYSSASNRDANISPGATIAPTLTFKHGSTVSGVPMTGTVYFRVTSGTTILLSSLTLVLGVNTLDMSNSGQLALIPANTASAVWSTASAGYVTTGTFGNDANINKSILAANSNFL